VKRAKYVPFFTQYPALFDVMSTVDAVNITEHGCWVAEKVNVACNFPQTRLKKKISKVKKTFLAKVRLICQQTH